MPTVVETENDEQTWLNEGEYKLLKPLPSDLIKTHQISSLINSPKNDTVDVIQISY